MSTKSRINPTAWSSALLLGCQMSVAQAEDGVAKEAAADSVAEVLVLGRGYQENLAGAKDLVPVFETPSSITVIDLERFENQRLVSIEDLFRETVGVTTTKTVSSYPSFFARGFEISSFLVDGVPGSSGVSAPYSVPDLFLYERVELLRGPSALFSGSGSPGGSLNLARKRPKSEFEFRSSIQGGSWDFFRGEADITAPLNSTGSVRGRAGVAYQDAQEFIDRYDKDRTLVFGSVAFDLSETTTLTLGAYYDDYQSTIQVGLPGVAGTGLVEWPRETFFGGDENYFETQVSQAYGEIAQRLGERWSGRLSVQYTSMDREEEYLWGRGPITATDGAVALSGYHGTHDAELLSADLSAVGEFDLGGRTHGLLFGADYQRSEWTYASNSASVTGLTFDFYEPVIHSQPDLPIQPGQPEFFTGSEVKTQYGVYGQTRLSLADRLTGVVGGRAVWVTYDYQEFDAVPTGVYELSAEFSPYFGLVYDIAPNWNVYGSFADVFEPQSAIDANFDPLGPVTGRQLEAGVKGNLFDQRLLLSAAVYRIRQSGRAVADPNDPNFSVDSGLVESKGFELEANGRLSRNWTFDGGYTQTKNEVLRDTDPLLVGTQFLAVIPEHSVKAFTNYEFTEGALQGFSLGGGLTWNGSAAGGDASLGRRVEQDSYVVLGLRMGYDFSETVSASLNVNNLLDEEYYENIRDIRFGNYYGAPRSAFLRVSFKY
jgi:outer membrane receptor for ferric coprogen and ferric-rhodotorulic acid